MAAAKLFIDPNEDVVFTASKIARAEGSKVIAVIPEGANVLASQVSLKLISRMILKTDKLVVLVTQDELGQRYAKRAGLVAVEKVSHVDQGVWTKVNDNKQRQAIAKSKRKQELLSERTEKTEPTGAAKDTRVTPLAVMPVESAPDNSSSTSSETADVKEALQKNNEQTEVPQQEETEKISLDETGQQLRETPKTVAPPSVIMPVPTPLGDLGKSVSPTKLRGTQKSSTTSGIGATSEEVKPLFNKLDPKIVDLDSFALLAGGDVAQSALGSTLRNKLRNISKLRARTQSQQQQKLMHGHSVSSNDTSSGDSDVPEPEPPQPPQPPQSPKSPEVRSVESTKKAQPVSAEGATAHSLKKSAFVSRDFSKVEDTSLSPTRTGPAGSRPARRGSPPPRRPAASSRQLRYQLSNVKSSQAIQSIQIFVANLASRASLLLNGSGSSKKIALGAGAVLVIFFAISVTVFPAAEIRVDLKSASVPISEQITAVEGADSVDIEQLTIPMTPITQTLSRSETGSATGTKETGEKATGKVTILNTGSSPANLAAGTVISKRSSNDLNYVLPTAVTLAGGDTKTGINIVAAEFGERYNDTSSFVKSFTTSAASDLEIVSNQAITGGSSREVTVVTQEDINSVRDGLVNLLRSDLTTELSTLVGDNEVVISPEPRFGEPQISVNQQVGAEVDTFDVDAELTATVFIVNRTDLAQLASELAARNSTLAGDFEIEELGEVSVQGVEFVDGRANFSVESSADIGAKVDSEEVKASVLGLSVSEAESHLSQLPDVEDYEINYSPGYLPGFLRRLPGSPDRVVVELSD